MQFEGPQGLWVFIAEGDLTMKIPELPLGFTPEFLTELLQTEGYLPEAEAVASVGLTTIGDGTGMMAEIAGLSLTYEGEGSSAPRHLVAKFSSQNPTNREISMSYRLNEREARFMSELASQTELRIPNTYYVGNQGDRLLILMEDLSDYEVGSQVVGADLKQSELAIDALVKLHAPFWDRVADLDWVPHIAESFHADNMVQFSNIGAPVMIERFEPVINQTYLNRLDEFLAGIPRLQAMMNKGPVTLCHGDFRMENLLYGVQPSHDGVVVIDWQGPLRAQGMNDVALFLGQSTQTSVRRDHERQLIARYVDGLTALGVPGLAFESAFEAYRASVLYNWVYITVVGGTLDVSNPKAHAWIKETIARQSATSEDLQVFDYLD